MRWDRRWLDRVATAGTVAALSDRELLRRFVARADDRAFAALMARHGPMVLGVCRRHLDDGHAAEDAFQATWLVLVRRAASLRDADRLGPWLHGVARRVALRAREVAARRRAVERLGLDADPPAAPEPDDAHAARQSALDEEVARMPERLRSPLVLCYLEGLTHEEVTHRLGCPLGTVRSRIARSRVLLRDRLARRGLVAPEVGLATPSPWLSPAVLEGLFDATCRAGLGVASGSSLTAAGVSGLVITLTTEAVRMLQVTRWKARLFALAVLGTSAGGVWLAVSHGHDQPPDPTPVAGPSRAENPTPGPAPADQSAEFRGIVVDPDGRPVAGATVVYGSTDAGRSGHEEVRTNPDGTFTCLRPSGSRSLAIVIHQQGFQILIDSYSGDLLGTPDQPVKLSLRKFEPFRATLVDEQGQPVVDAEVRVSMYMAGMQGTKFPRKNATEKETKAFFSKIFNPHRWVPDGLISGTDLEPLFRARTDATGAFQLRAMGGEGVSLKLLVTSSKGQSFLVRHRWNPTKIIGQTPGEPDDSGDGSGRGFTTSVPGKPLTLVTVPAARIEGRVVSRIPGQSLSGMIAYCHGSEPLSLRYKRSPLGSGRPSDNLGDRAPIGPDGRFVLDHLSKGTVNVIVQGPGENKDWTYEAAQDVELEPGRTSETTIELIRGVEVTGMVRYVFTEQPVEDALIGVRGPVRPGSGTIALTTLTDGQGRYTFRLPPGETEFYVSAIKRGTQKFVGSTGQNVTIPERATTFQVPPILVTPVEADPN